MPVLGIDTSCYTTSMAVVDGPQLLSDERKLLMVEAGGRGLQQSNALFQHVQNLPLLFDQLNLSSLRIGAVAVSARPRPRDGSYMPVFTAGYACAKAVASALGVPLFETSHQEGHIAAGCFSLGMRPSSPFLAFHISGGTTELLRAEPDGAGYRLDIVGETIDLHAGQVVDRVGVALGLRFPAGPALERLAKEHCGVPVSKPLKAFLDGANCSLSGMESTAQRLIAAGDDGGAVAHEVQRCLASVFISMALAASEATGLNELLVIGGVASNEFIRGQLTETLGRRGIRALFAVNPFSSDNAVGVAHIGQNLIG